MGREDPQETARRFMRIYVKKKKKKQTFILLCRVHADGFPVACIYI